MHGSRRALHILVVWCIAVGNHVKNSLGYLLECMQRDEGTKVWFDNQFPLYYLPWALLGTHFIDQLTEKE